MHSGGIGAGYKAGSAHAAMALHVRAYIQIVLVSKYAAQLIPAFYHIDYFA